MDETPFSKLVISEPSVCSKAVEKNADMKESDVTRDR